MLEVLQCQHHLDAHVGGRIGKHPAEGREGARIADAPERLNRGPLDLGVGQRGHQRLDGARIFHPSEGVGGGDADPPVGVAQQLNRGRHDPDIIEAGGHGDGAGTDIGIGVLQKLDDRIDERGAEFAQRLQ